MSTLKQKPVAWNSRSEFLSVYEELYSGHIPFQKLAIQRIAAWKSRVVSLPTAVVCTCELVSACVRDAEVCSSSEANTALELVRLTYSMAIVRFINIITDTGQKGLHAKSLHSMAQQLGVPSWVVECRHDSTHAQLPSLPLLRAAAIFIINWLKNNYWIAQVYEGKTSDFEKKFTVRKKDSNKEECVIQEVLPWLDKYIDMQIKFTYDRSKKRHKELQTMLSVIEEDDKNDASDQPKMILDRIDLYHGLLSEGHLILTEQQLVGLRIQLKEFLIPSLHISLPRTLLGVWGPILLYLGTSHMDLLITLCDTWCGDDVIKARQVNGWIYHLFKECLDDDKTFTPSSNSRIEDFRSLIRLILKHPNMWTVNLLSCMFKECKTGLSTAQQKHIINLVKNYLQSENASDLKMAKSSKLNGDSADDKKDVLSLEDLKMHTSQPFFTGQESDDLTAVESNWSQTRGTPINQQKWSLASENINWGRIPLGSCPGRSITDKNLVLRTSEMNDEYDADQSMMSINIEAESEHMQMSSEEADQSQTSIDLDESQSSNQNTSHVNKQFPMHFVNEHRVTNGESSPMANFGRKAKKRSRNENQDKAVSQPSKKKQLSRPEFSRTRVNAIINDIRIL